MQQPISPGPRPQRRIGAVGWILIIGAVLVIGAVVVVVGVVGLSVAVPVAIEANRLEHRRLVGVAGFDFEDRALVGIVTNAAPVTWRFVQVRFGLYDANRAKVGTAFDIVEGLAPNQAWKFRAVVLEKGAKSARLEALEVR